MGEVGGYLLHLYCDADGCTEQLEAYGKDLTEARRVARAGGWRVRRSLTVGLGNAPAWICEAHDDD